MDEYPDPDSAEETIGSDTDDTVPAARNAHVVPTVGLGGSAGSIPALQSFFAHVPPDSGMAYVVVIHLAPDHDSHLAEILQRSSKLPVVRVQRAATIERDHVYVIPPKQRLRAVDGALSVDAPLGERGRNAAVDLFFRTLAETFGAQATAIVLSGLDSDGAIGLKRVKEHGGLAIAQDPAEAEHAGMPRAAIATGMVDWVLPVAEMPARLIEYQRHEHKLKLPREDGPPPLQAEHEAQDDEAALRDILVFLRTRTGRDFSCYKRGTIVRRIARRMQVNGVDDLRGYLQTLRTLPGEAGALLQDLLISVTNFFRDSPCFLALQTMVPMLFRRKGLSDRVRVWVAACATGEEAYSIAMLLHEHASTLESPPLVQVFATDLDDHAIQIARSGVYPTSIEADVSPERLRRFFVKEHLSYRVRRELRESVLFAVHNALKDSPFSRLDMVSCRNLLIYLTRDVQAELLNTFHFALRGEGLLFLGSSETVEEGNPLFAVADKRHRIFVRRPVARTALPVPSGPGTLTLLAQGQARLVEVPVVPSAVLDASPAADGPRVARARDPNAASWAEMHFKLLEQLAPPSVIINAEHEIVHLSRTAGQFLQLTGGEPTTNLLRLVHPSLRIELRAAIFQATQQGAVAEVPWTSVDIGGEPREVSIRVAPVDEERHDYFLVVFDAHRRVEGEPSPAQHAPDPVAEQLDREVERLKAQLRDTVEQYEASNEELKASNEELQAMNEELRSATEELETGREELQSINEELSTVNHELKLKVDELGSSNSDMLNLMDATSIPTVFLNRSLHVTRYTPAAVPVFNLIPTDVGRPLSDLHTKLDYPTLAEDAGRVLERLVPIEREVSRAGENWYVARLLPYRTVDDRIAGVVLTLVDITERRRAADAARISEQRLRLVVDNARDTAIFSLDRERRVTTWNAGAERLLGWADHEIVGEPCDVLFTPEDRSAKAPQREVETALATGRAADDRQHLRRDGSRFWANGTLMPMRNNASELVGYVKILRDMSEARTAQEALEKGRAELLQALHGTDQARREAELQKEHLAALFSQAPMPICILRGPTHAIEFANPYMGKLWGREPAKVAGKPLFEAISRPRVTLDADALAGVLAEGLPRVAKEVAARMPRDAEGAVEDVWLNLTYAPLRNVAGEIDGVLVMAADVTDDRRAREQMTELHESEQAASRAKDDFLAMLGHELRNPLAPLRNALHLMRQRASEREDPLLDIADRQAGNLTRIVDDLLEAARITEGKVALRLEDIDLGETVKRAVESARPILDQHEHTLALTLPARPVTVRADPVRIEQIVYNLLINAAKYTPTGGRIEVVVRKLGKTGELRVIDNGIGISPDLHPRLFHLFQQGDRPLSRDDGGLGIGLSVVRHLVALHGGSVEARSEGTGKGSTFIVRLPTPPARAAAAAAGGTQAAANGAPARAPAAAAASPGTPEAVPAPAPLRVLVVDDNHDAGVTLLMVVEALGHDVRLARDGRAALDQAAKWKPDIVFLDIGLPGMDGYEVARELRRQPGGDALHLVAVTGYGQDRDRTRTLDAGFDEHLVKPATYESIQASLAGALRRS
jgi:two-component system CheB/CheR fusion protein